MLYFKKLPAVLFPIATLMVVMLIIILTYAILSSFFNQIELGLSNGTFICWVKVNSKILAALALLSASGLATLAVLEIGRLG